MHDTAVGVGGAVSAGLGLGLGLFLVPHMFQAMAPNRRITRTVIICLSCRGKNTEDFRFCGHCGRALYPPPRIQCPRCDKTVPAMKFCENCGAKLKE